VADSAREWGGVRGQRWRDRVEKRGNAGGELSGGVVKGEEGELCPTSPNLQAEERDDGKSAGSVGEQGRTPAK